jgi:hypothetical protein
MGKIVNKFMIIDIFGYAGKSKKVAQILFGANKNMRNLLIRNLKSFKIQIKK